MKNRNKTSKKHMSKKTKTILLISSIFIILAAFFIISFCFGIFGPTSYSFNKAIKPYINTLNSINSNSKSYVNKKDNLDTLNVKLVKEKLETDITNNLIKAKKDIESVKFPEKLASKQKNLCDGIDSNILIYRQIKLIATTESPKELNDLCEILKTYKKNTKHNYQLVKDKTFLIEFPTSLDNLIAATLKYSEDFIEEYNKNNISKEQKQLFSSQLNDISTEFYKLIDKNNYIANVNRILDDQGSLDEVLSSLSKDISSINSLKIKLSEVSIPQDSPDIYYSIQNLLKDYDLYLQNLKQTVTTEKSTFDSKGKRNKDLIPKYDKLTETFKSINTSYSLFHTTLTQYIEEINK